MATTIRFNDDDQAAIIRLAARTTGGNQAAAIRQAIRDALRPQLPTPYEDRYRALMLGQYRDLRVVFSLPDMGCIADAVNGWLIQPHDVTMLYSEVEDFLDDPEMATRHYEVRAAVLVDRLRGLTPVQCHALLYALEDAKRRADITGSVAWHEVLGGMLRGPSSN